MSGSCHLRWRCSAALAVALTASLGAVALAAHAAGPATGGDKLGSLVVLGDSIGDIPSGTNSYVDLLARDLEHTYGSIQVHRAARGGARYADLGPQVASLPARLPGPVAVTITIGGNDMRSAMPQVLTSTDQAPRAALARNLRAAVGALVRPGRFGDGVAVRVFVTNIYDASDGRGEFAAHRCAIPVGPLDSDPLFGRWNGDLAAAVAGRGDVMVLDLHGAFRGHGFASRASWYQTDCIHPSPTGHQQLAKLFLDAITAARIPAQASGSVN